MRLVGKLCYRYPRHSLWLFLKLTLSPSLYLSYQYNHKHYIVAMSALILTRDSVAAEIELYAGFLAGATSHRI